MSHRRIGLRSMKFPVLLLLLAASPALAKDGPVMVLEGDMSAVHDSGMFTVVDPLHPEILQWWRARTGSPAPGYELPAAHERPLGTIAQAPIHPDGTESGEETSGQGFLLHPAPVIIFPQKSENKPGEAEKKCRALIGDPEDE